MLHAVPARERSAMTLDPSSWTLLAEYPGHSPRDEVWCWAMVCANAGIANPRMRRLLMIMALFTVEVTGRFVLKLVFLGKSRPSYTLAHAAMSTSSTPQQHMHELS